MRKERIQLMKQNSLASGIIIKLVLVGIYVFLACQTKLGIVFGVYLIARCIIKVIRLSIKLVLLALLILFLLVTIAVLSIIIF